VGNLLQDLRDRGVHTGYQRYVLMLEPILVAMGKKGMPVAPARHAEVLSELQSRQGECEKAMQALIPPEVKTCKPPKGYKREPKDTAGMVKRYFPTVNGDETLQEERWCRLNEWKPSHDGLIRYMKYRNHKVPLSFKENKPTTVEPELVRLANQTKDLLYDAVLEYRNISTVLNNHMANWVPTKAGRVHPTFYYDTGTGQLATRRPNVQNAPKHGEDTKKEIADMFRSMVIAKEGHTLVSFDYKSFHAQTLAFEARDKDYLRLAKLDIHSYLTAHLVRHPDRDRMLGWADADLSKVLSQVKKEHRFIRDYKAKRAILGYGFGMGYRKLYNMYREAFESQGDAKRTVDMLNALFPRANKWRDDVRALAHEQGYLISRFGCIRYFWEVFRWGGGQWQQGGDDSEAAIAFLPANDAFCHIKEAMLRLDPVCGQYLINQIHDDLMYEIPDPELDNLIPAIASEMEKASPVLVNEICPDGLSVEVGVALGKRWDKMEDVQWKSH